MGGFSLHKWAANNSILLDKIPENLRADFNDTNYYFGLLSLNWDTANDSFSFNLNIDILEGKITKREVLSSIAKLYDPLDGFRM